MGSTAVLIEELSKVREAGKAALSALMVTVALHDNRCKCVTKVNELDRCPGLMEARDAITQLREALK